MIESESRSTDTLRQVLVVIATIATIVFNGLSQSIPIGGRTSADVSNQYLTYFTPANYAFAIWGFIYLLLIAYTVYQALPNQRTNPKARQIGWLYILSCVLNCVWITLFQYDQIVISMLVILGLLVTLIAIYWRLNNNAVKPSTTDRWFLHLPFSVYLGWVSVATIANVAVLGVSQQWNNPLGIANPTWAAIMLVVATIVGLIMAVTRRDVAYILVFVWAFLAIVNKQSGTPVVSTTAIVTVIVLLVVLAGSYLFGNRTTRPLASS